MNLGGDANLLLYKKLPNLTPLITRQLDYLRLILILSDTSVAFEGLLQSSRNLFHIQVFRQTLDSGNTLAPVTLLNAHVDLTLAFATGRKRIC